MRSIFNKIILCVVILGAKELSAMSRGEEVMNLLGCKEPNRISWFVPRHKLKKLPSKLDIGLAEYEINDWHDGTYRWIAVGDETKNFGFIYMRLVPDCSHVMQFAFEEFVRGSSADAHSFSCNKVIKQDEKCIEIYDELCDRMYMIVRDNVVIKVTTHQKDANKIAKAIYEYQFGEGS